ncbi:MAG: hypothetical protein PQJ61_03945 [Spirochaetales bacterium]|uniref:Ribosome maturation factor RimP n=1 Tax=Candidatus Thalassospirochaeta sargassi TaxID=3119039 RepID=A0AAJ1IB16_9SPIO|nr:hypothetical protein [Spirochaetales bacterium]
MLIIIKEDRLKFSSYEENELFSIVKPICDGFKTGIVQLNSAVVNTNLQVRIVLYKKGGINIDTCTQISRAVMPRIEVWADNRDVNLEVSSPGVGRTLKDAWEFQIFKDENINLLIDNNWIEGKISDADNSKMKLQTASGESEYMYEQIQKAKLD